MIHFSVFKLFDFRPPKSRTYASLNSISAKYGLPINTAGFGCQLSIYSWEAPISFMSSRPCDPWKGKRLRLVAPIRGVHERSFGRFLGNLQYRFYCICRQCLHSVCGILLNDIPTVQTHTKNITAGAFPCISPPFETQETLNLTALHLILFLFKQASKCVAFLELLFMISSLKLQFSCFHWPAWSHRSPHYYDLSSHVPF